jgi:hypothetical protein
MHNWWIAALEEFGLITREEAEHISEQIRLSIHKDVYRQAYEEFHSILERKNLDGRHVFDELQNDILTLKNDVAELKAAASKKVVATKK